MNPVYVSPCVASRSMLTFQLIMTLTHHLDLSRPVLSLIFTTCGGKKTKEQHMCTRRCGLRQRLWSPCQLLTIPERFQLLFWCRWEDEKRPELQILAHTWIKHGRPLNMYARSAENQCMWGLLEYLYRPSLVQRKWLFSFYCSSPDLKCSLQEEEEGNRNLLQLTVCIRWMQTEASIRS